MEQNSEKLEANQCALCQKPATHKCGGCRKVYYCDKLHQREDWREHKKICISYKVSEDDNLGRFLVATRPIKAGEVVLKEPPLIWGPAPNSIPICLGCGKGINENNSRPCFKCGWPVCGELCEKSPAHLPECRYTTQKGERVHIKNFGIPHPIYRCITVLRCLYQKQFLPKSFKKLKSLESHDDARKSTAAYEGDRIAIAEFIRRFFKLSGTFTEEQIMKICGIVAVNSHEMPLSDPPCHAIYGNASMLEHECTSNCAKSFTGDGQIVIIAAKDVKQGDHLSISYADSLWGTPNRRYFLNETKFFWCQCRRCQDVTEFGTYLSALHCQGQDCQGLILPESFVETKNKLPDWICHKCKRTISAYSAHDVLERVGRDLLEVDKTNVKELQTFLKTYENYLGDNHFYFTEVKYVLSQLLGQENGLSGLSDEDLLLKKKLCENLVGLLRILAAAEKRTLGMVLFELHASLAEIARRKSAGDSCAMEMRFDLLESRRILVEAVEMLKFEPDLLPEGKVCNQARENLKSLDLVLKTLQNNMKAEIL